MKIKVCGLTRAEDVALACELGAWAVGLVFAESPRKLGVEKAKALRARISPGTLAVGVFSGASAADIEAAAKACRLDLAQVHGAVPAGLSVPVLRVVHHASEPVAGWAGVLVEPERTTADRFAGAAPAQGARHAAWAEAAKLKGKTPLVVVAGGLTPRNVAEAIAAARPDAVDVSSGVERAPGAKDPALLEAFFTAARGA